MAAILLTAGGAGTTRAENVDTELLLLVDITRPGLSDSEFSDLMDGYANAFTTTEILDSIQSGATGRIAVSMMLYGNSSTQVVGIPWMMIGSQADANVFASLARNLSRPFSVSTSDVAAALSVATASFGTETGGASNGFESTMQIVEIATAKKQPNNTAAGAASSSSASIASGVDLINAIALGNQANAIDSFYTDNVIGSGIEGVTASSTPVSNTGAFTAAVAGMVSSTVTTGAAQSLNAVPEPTPLFGLLPASLLLWRRRRG
ncbi:MAG: DUF1194 domain-containing protein [Akkermansiaceae bacterium]|nr:DUF1194 domain-containing protein [Akkermansiaceae bacterium]MCP5544257.1 DUF1194 domain-containing protein [Akkermansiaceae bacterium]